MEGLTVSASESTFTPGSTVVAISCILLRTASWPGVFRKLLCRTSGMKIEVSWGGLAREAGVPNNIELEQIHTAHLITESRYNALTINIPTEQSPGQGWSWSAPDTRPRSGIVLFEGTFMDRLVLLSIDSLCRDRDRNGYRRGRGHGKRAIRTTCLFAHDIYLLDSFHGFTYFAP